MAEAETKMSETLKFNNHRLGDIEVEVDAVLTFPAGILGFSDCRRFALLPHRPGTPFFWLIPIDRDDIAFVVVNPETFFPDYLPSLTPDQLAPLNLGPDADHSLGMLVVVSFHGGSPTANLRAPLILDLARRRAIQAVQMGQKFDTQMPLFQGVKEE
jgi:flagellar assembly factor FliW